jgi:hypothetical protein
MSSKRLITRADALLIGAVALAALLLWLLTARQSGPVAYIYVDGAFYTAARLDSPSEITIDQGGGVVNRLVVVDGAISMHSASCQNQDCVLQGWLSEANAADRPLQNWIVCLPNRVTVELKGPGL